MHLDYCKSFGISQNEILATEEHQGKSVSFVPCLQRSPFSQCS